jgi:CBS domain containing-hemolysin-like protein
MNVKWAPLGDPVIIGRLILQIGLFVASATFSMSETSLFSLRESDLDNLEERKTAKEGHVRALLDELHQLNSAA